MKAEKLPIINIIVKRNDVNHIVNLIVSRVRNVQNVHISHFFLFNKRSKEA